jgi:hypothetical protein
VLVVRITQTELSTCEILLNKPIHPSANQSAFVFNLALSTPDSFSYAISHSSLSVSFPSFLFHQYAVIKLFLRSPPPEVYFSASIVGSARGFTDVTVRPDDKRVGVQHSIEILRMVTISGGM